MGGVVTYLVRDGVAIIEIDHPPLNVLTRAMCRELFSALDQAEEAADVGAVVLRARGRTFGSGTEASAPDSQDGPSLRSLCRRLDGFPKPVIAAIHGPVLGNGADLALAAHYRIAQMDTLIGFPEVRLGLLPSAGGVQRLSRLVGAEMATRMLGTGRALSAKPARQLGLLDRLVQDKAGVASFALAKELIADGSGPRPTMGRDDHMADPARYVDAVARFRAGLTPDAPEVMREIVNCVEAALLLPAEEGLDYEFAAREGLRLSDVSAALCHLARADRRAQQALIQIGAEPRKVATAGVIGGNAVSARIVAALLDQAFDVVWSEPDESALEDAYARIGEFYDARIAAKAITPEAAEDSLDRLTMVCGFQAFTDADLVIDALSSDTASAIARAAEVDAVVPAGSILAVLSPGVALGALARSTSRPGDVLGLRLPTFAPGAAGAELVTTPDTARHAVATMAAVLKQVGRVAVVSVDADENGGIVAGILGALQRATDALIAQGAEAGTLEKALEEWGIARGVLSFLAAARQITSDADRQARVAVAGAAGGAPAGRPTGPTPYRLSPETITRVCLAAMVNEGARLLSAGVARMPSDIDALAVHGLGFARRTGGPMKAGDLAGLLSLRRALPRLGQTGGIGGSPAPLLDDLIKNGRGFDSLNHG